MSSAVIKAFDRARESREKAYAPYSKFQVGACIKLKGEDEFFSGCNVENASFGATVCAERNAIFGAISDQGQKEFDFLVLVTDTEPAALPCGLCLQVIAEFCPPEFPIHIANLQGIQRQVKLADLLPEAFDPTHLK